MIQLCKILLECGEHRRFGSFFFDGPKERIQSGDPRRTPKICDKIVRGDLAG
jgi:hypothetical protein